MASLLTMFEQCMYKFMNHIQKISTLTIIQPFINFLGERFPMNPVPYQGFWSSSLAVEVAYGHHPCSVNIYVPLTPINRTSSLFLETCLENTQGTYGFFFWGGCFIKVSCEFNGGELLIDGGTHEQGESGR